MEVMGAFCYADWAGDRTERRSMTGTLIQIGGTTVAGKSLKQRTVALSATEAEIISVIKGTKVVVWIRSLLKGLKAAHSEIKVIHKDDQFPV